MGVTSSTETILNERSELLQLIEQNQYQILLAQQRVAFLNGVLTERGVDLAAAADGTEMQKVPNSSSD